jgi:hypothetical protein
MPKVENDNSSKLVFKILVSLLTNLKAINLKKNKNYFILDIPYITLLRINIHKEFINQENKIN